ncbi:MAG TPA: hypothetical protein VFX56_10975 [Nitrospira sp.]|nr:hypothetical protein [Nitrospira sp.]
MAKEMLRQVSRERCVMAGLMSLLLLWLGGCASEQPKPSGAAVTPEQVRSHADKAFDKLKQEEQHRSVDPTVGR